MQVPGSLNRAYALLPPLVCLASVLLSVVGCDYGKKDLRQCQDLRAAGKLADAVEACERSEKRGGDSGAEAARLLPTLHSAIGEQIASEHLETCLKLREENPTKALAACEQAAGVADAGAFAEKAKAAIPGLKEAVLEAEKDRWWTIGSRLSDVIRATGFADLKYGRMTMARDVLKAEAGEPSGVYNSGWGTETFVWGRKFGDEVSTDDIRQAPFSVQIIANVACGDFTSPMASIYSYGQEIRSGSVRPKVVPAAQKAPPSAGSATGTASDQLLTDWLSAQNSGDFEAYSKLYEADFRGVKNVAGEKKHFDRQGWLNDRKGMFANSFSVEASDSTVEEKDGTQVITFTQTWRSTGYADRGTKVLHVRDGNIIREEQLTSAPIAPGPTESEWAAVKEVMVKGSSALTCETKILNGFFRAVCEENDGGKPKAVSFSGKSAPGAVARVEDGKLVLIHPYTSGTEFTALFTWAGKASRLHVSWPAGAPQPQMVGTFDGAPPGL